MNIYIYPEMLRQAPAQRGVQRRGHPGEKNSGTERRMRQSVYFRQSDDAKNNNVRYLLHLVTARLGMFSFFLSLHPL